MNHPLLRWLLDIDLLPEGDEPLHFVWSQPWPAWFWSLLVVLAFALAFWSYRRLEGRGSLRAVLVGVRGLVLLLALALIAGPMLELRRETIEPDWLLVLADRSRSLQVADILDGPRRKSRDEQLNEILDAHQATFDAIATDREVHWFGFSGGAFTLDPAAGLGDADGERTDLDRAIDQALQRAAARPVSGILLLSDGRTNHPPSRATLRRLQSDAVQVFTVPLGSSDALGDVAIRRLDAPQRAFVRDKVPVVVELERLGSAAAGVTGTVSLVDETTGEVLDEAPMPSAGEDQVTLTATPKLGGDAAWAVVINPDEPDLVPENNRRPIAINLVDRPLRVLYVDGYPRWEYRYLKNLLVREKSIDSSIMLLSADRDFAQEGNQPITRLPRSPEELARYDVVIIGDVPAQFFSADQLEMIRQHVADRGAGLLWVGGRRNTPHTYGGTVLADLLPMRGSLELPIIGAPVTIRPTLLANRLGVLRLVTDRATGWPEELMDPAMGWSQFYQAQRIEPGRLKPTAEVLAETVAPIGGAPLPIVMQLRYGAGQSIYVATDEIWRWRFGRGEFYPEQFWIQMVRMLGRESLSAAGASASLTVAPKRMEIRQPLRVELRIADAALVDQTRESVRATLEARDGTVVTELELRRVPGTEDRFAATYMPDQAGDFIVRIDDPAWPGLALQEGIEIFRPDDERRRPEADHDMMEQLATTTGGEMLAPDDLGRLPDLLPRREVRTPNPIRERLWDTPLAFILVLGLLSLEWVGRRILRLS